MNAEVYEVFKSLVHRFGVTLHVHHIGINTAPS